MAIPDFQRLTLPLLRLAGDGREHTLSEAIDRLAHDLALSNDDRAELLPSGKQPRFDNRVGWAATYLRKAGLLRAIARGRFDITDRGREVLAEPPDVIDIGYLARFPGVREFRARDAGEDDGTSFDESTGEWTMRPEVAERVRKNMERAFPDAAIRLDVLRLMAFAIENADEERSDSWCVRESGRGLQLLTGRLLACRVERSRLQLAVVGPISDAIRSAVGADPANDDSFKWIEGSILLRLPVERAAIALELLSDPFNAFVDEAMARLRKRPPSVRAHVPEAVQYVGAELDRELPQPDVAGSIGEVVEPEDGGEEGKVPTALHLPEIRGRAPIFEHSQRSIASLMEDIAQQRIALPDLQRPFVWEDTKVRDLLDSIFVGYPVGTLVLWLTSHEKEARALGAERPSLRATTLVIDGQQRLTSLFAVMRGVEVVGKDGDRRKVRIAFRPRDGRFDVSDAANRNDPEYLANLTDLWDGTRSKPTIRREIMNAVRDHGRAVDDAYEEAMERNLDRAAAIAEYRFPVVEIRKTAAREDEDVDEEDVAEIFVRINNQGTRLVQADFVLTLLSVFHGELRDRIEERAREMSDGSVVTVDAQQLLRAACGVAFGRARMSAVYKYLRGVDPITGDADPASRKRRLEQLDDAANEIIAPTPWRDYLLRVTHAGFVTPGLIASKNAIVYAYAFYVRGRKAGIAKHELDELIARWVFASLLTARYSGATETMFEKDLARTARLPPDDADGFVRALDEAMSEVLTGDYWTLSLAAELETQRARAPAALAFRAAQVVLGTRALFSDQLLRNLLDPPAKGARSASEAHHLFPVAWLHARGVVDRRDVNQVANLADTGWYENSSIGARGPSEYVPRLREKLAIDDEAWARLCAEHALPPGWEEMDYAHFLRERRRRMAEIVRVAFRKLGGEIDAPPLTPPWFLPGAELVWQRIGETERAVRAVVREVFVSRFGDGAAAKIEAALSERERDTLARALRSRPAGADPLSVVDYLYLGQLLTLVSGEMWQHARDRFGGTKDAKQRLTQALEQIAPVRNEIAHVREVTPERLMRANLACGDLLELMRRG